MSWAALDTETQRGAAALVCWGKRGNVRVLEHPTSFGQVIQTIAESGVERAIAWNAQFDSQAILKLSLSTRELADLALYGRGELDGWTIRYLPSKILDCRRGKLRATLFDGYQFFNRGLDSAAKKFLGAKKLPHSPALDRYFKRGLLGDALRDPETRQECIDYCARDVELADDLWGIVWRSLLALGMPEDTRPLSPASVARRYWREALGETRHVGRESFAWRKPARMAYRGGRIEVTARGRFPNVSRWDIHSAYPSAMVRLPHISKCVAVDRKEIRRDASYALARLYLDIPRETRPGPVAVDDDVLIYPTGRFSVWADLHTWRYLEECGFVREVQEARQWIATDAVYPYRPMAELYKRRKTDPEASHAIKTVLNGTYGLLAERVNGWTDSVDVSTAEWVGERWRERYKRDGATQSFLAASHVTGLVRTRLARECPTALAYMTDGVILPEGDAPLGKHGDALGEWGHEGDGEAVIVGSGLYATRDTGAEHWIVKRRGWARLRLLEQLRGAGSAKRLDLAELRAASMRECAQGRASWRDLNDLQEVPRALDLNFDKKRTWPREMRARDFLDPAMAQHGATFHRVGSRDRPVD